MNEEDRLRALLLGLRNRYCRGNAAELGRRIEKDASYVNRLFYPSDKKGAKGIGLEIMGACTKAFSLSPGFWEMDPDAAFPERSPKRRMSELMAATGWTQSDIARIGGTTEQIAETWIAGSAPNLISASALAAQCDFSAQWIANGVSPKHSIPKEDENRLEEIGPVAVVELVPVIGYAKLGEDGFYDLQAYDSPEGYVPFFSRSKGLYALRVRGTSMAPAVNHAEIVVVHGEGKPVVGEKVAVCLKDGRKLVKKLLSYKGGFAEVESVNGGALMLFGPDETESVHPVVATLPGSVLIPPP